MRSLPTFPYKKSDRRKANLMAQALAAIINLPAGNTLVLFLGSGEESDNVDALATWVLSYMDSASDQPTKTMFHEMMDQLEYTLSRLEHIA